MSTHTPDAGSSAGPPAGVVLMPAARILGDRAGFLRLRRAGIGASEAAAALGVSPWETRDELVQRIAGAPAPELSAADLARMRWGRRLERPIALGVLDDFPALGMLRAGPGLVADREFSNVRATPDFALLPRGANGRGHLLEVKNMPGTFSPGVVWVPGAPCCSLDVWLQVQAQLRVTGRRYCWVVALVDGRGSTVPVRVEAAPEFAAALAAYLSWFHETAKRSPGWLAFEHPDPIAAGLVRAARQLYADAPPASYLDLY